MKDLSLHILDIVQNSIAARANRIEIEIYEETSSDQLRITIRDNGSGMTPEFAARAADPYVTSRQTRKVGLGLPLLKQNAERTGGRLTISSTPEKGTTITAVFGMSNPDRPPMGDLSGTLVTLAATNSGIRFIYKHTTDRGTYEFDTHDVEVILEGASMQRSGIIRFLKEMINENLHEIKTAG